MIRRLRRRTAPVVLLAFLLPVAGLAGGLAPAAALPQDGDPILVEIGGITPLVPTTADSLTVTGTITNRSDQRVRDLQALLRVSPEPLRSRSAVAAVTDLTTPRRGVTQPETLTPVTPELAPGSSAPFSITVATSDLPLGGNGVYALFAEARSPDVGSFDTAIPLPWFPRPQDVQPSRIVVAAPLRAPVDLTANDSLMSSDLISGMEPGGALHSIAAGGAAAAAAGVPITWLIDPAVTDAATRLAEGSASMPDGVADAGAARDSVRSWLDLVAAGTAQPSASTYLTPYGEVDASAVISGSMAGLLAESVAASQDPAAGGAPLDPAGVIAVPPGGNTTSAALSAYRDRGVGSAVLDDSAVPPVDSLSYTPSGVADVPLPDGGSITALIPDAALAADLQRPAGTPAEAFRLRQGLLADAALLSLELPTSPRTVMLLPAEQTNLAPAVYTAALAELAGAPFVTLAGLSALQEPGVPRVDRRSNLDESDAGRLSAEYLSPIPPINDRLAAFSRVTVEPLTFEADFRSALLRSTSAHWRSDLPGGEALLRSVDRDLTAEEQKVTTVSTGTVTFSGSSGRLPLTISNELDQAVEVGVLLQANPMVRLTFTPPGLVLVDARKRVSIEIPVEVFGSGPLPVEVVLTDRDGRPFIRTADLVIRSTATSLIAAGVAIIGGVALLVLVLWRFRRKGAVEA